MVCIKCGKKMKKTNTLAWVLIVMGVIGLFSFEFDTIMGSLILILIGFFLNKKKKSDGSICNSCKKIERRNKTNSMQQNIENPMNTKRGNSSSTYSETKSTQQHQDYLVYSKIRKLTSDFTVLDFETTGLNPIHDKIIQVAAVKYRDFEKIDEFVCYVNPEIKISSRITEITGLTNKDLKDAKTIQEILPELNNFIRGETLVAHNAPFDMKFLLTKKHEYGLDYEKYRVLCTLSLARKYIDFTKDHKLVTLKSMLGLNQFNPHDALHDCYVTAELYKYCYEKSLVKN